MLDMKGPKIRTDLPANDANKIKLIKEGPNHCFTLVPAFCEFQQMANIIDASLSVARCNFSLGDHEGHLACVNRLRTAAKQRNKPVIVMLDTTSNKNYLYLRPNLLGASVDGK